MTQEEKDLVLQDICARLPYGVKFKWCDNFHTDDYYTFIGINEELIIGWCVCSGMIVPKTKKIEI